MPRWASARLWVATPVRGRYEAPADMAPRVGEGADSGGAVADSGRVATDLQQQAAER
jgi:hypothetical protein